LAFVAAIEGWTVGKLRKENAILRQTLHAGASVESQNLELATENQQLQGFKQTSLDEINRLELELQNFRENSNSWNSTAEVYIARARIIEEENFALEAQLTGASRVPRSGAWLGVSMGNAQDGSGTVVESVVDRSPAAKANLQEGDIIEAVDGQLVQGADEFKAIMAQKTGGQITFLDLIRDRAPLRIEVSPIDWPQ